MPRISAKITAVAGYVPPRVVTNDDLAKIVDTSDEWIFSRTGIKKRHYLEPGEATSDLILPAAREVLERTGTDPSEIDLIVVATITPDTSFPATACVIQDKLGASNAWGFDLSAACSGFVFALTVGAQFVGAGTHKKVLVCGADTMTSIVDFEDRATCILFGDGGGVVLLEPSEENEGILDFAHDIDGSGGEYLYMTAGGSRCPTSAETVANREHFVRQEGQHVFKYAVRRMYEIPKLLLDRNGIAAEDLGMFVPHQANLRIIQVAAKKLGLRDDQFFRNIQDYGNTTAATIPLALADAETAGKIKSGDSVLLASVGAGFTSGGMLLRWA